MDETFREDVLSTVSGIVEIEFKSGEYGSFARIRGIEHGEIKPLLATFEELGYGTAMIETSAGAGIEVWTE